MNYRIENILRMTTAIQIACWEHMTEDAKDLQTSRAMLKRAEELLEEVKGLVIKDMNTSSSLS